MTTQERNPAPLGSGNAYPSRVWPVWQGGGGGLNRVRRQASQHPLTFVCGPTTFIETVAENLIALGYPPEWVKTERFGGT